MSYNSDLEENVRRRIAQDLKNHKITVKHEFGLYRHYRCQQEGTSNQYFDIVTWPGYLCYVGDMGYYLFTRTEDMIPFMRSACMSYSYAAEKCVAHDGGLKEWREELFSEYLEDYLKEYPEHAEKIAELRSDVDYDGKYEKSKAMYESGLFDEIPTCEAYTFHFLWCLHAIKWFCEQHFKGSHTKCVETPHACKICKTDEYLTAKCDSSSSQFWICCDRCGRIGLIGISPKTAASNWNKDQQTSSDFV